MKDPIIFMHFGHSWYLEHTLKCAKAFNPDTNIFLFGDDSNRDIAIQSGVIFDYYENYGGIGDYRKDFEDLKNNYTHIGSAPAAARPKHHFNIMRWPRLIDIMVDYSIESCWYFDSDTLICRDLYEIKLSNQFLYTINHISGCAAYINDIIVLDKLRQIIYEYRRNKEFIDYHKSMIEERAKIGKLYNLCDMSYIRIFKEKYKQYTEDLAWPLFEGDGFSVFDWNINTSTADQIKDYPFKFRMKDGKKEIGYRTKMTFSSIKKGYKPDKNLKIPFFTKTYLDYSDSAIRANTLNMSWSDPVFFNKVLSDLGLK